MTLLTQKIWLVWILCWGSPQHDFHASIAEMNYNNKSKAFEITLKVFTDDLEADLNRTFKGKKYYVDFAGKDKEINAAIEKYLNIYFYLKDKKGKKSKAIFIGREADVEATTIYFEIPYKGSLKNTQLVNTVMLDLFDDQSNIVNINYLSKKKTLRFLQSKRQFELEF